MKQGIFVVSCQLKREIVDGIQEKFGIEQSMKRHIR